MEFKSEEISTIIAWKGEQNFVREAAVVFEMKSSESNLKLGQ